MSKEELNKINRLIKSYLNEASGISNKCRNRLIKLIEKYFYVDLPHENYLNIDIAILENGNIIMREEEYKTSNELTSSKDLVNRFTEFQKDVEVLLNKNETNFAMKKTTNEIANLIVLFLIFIVMIVIFIFSIRELIYGNIFGVLWLVFIITYYIVPATGNKLRNRLLKAKRFIQKKFTKK